MSDGSQLIRPVKAYADAFINIFGLKKYSWLSEPLPIKLRTGQLQSFVDLGERSSFYLFYPTVPSEDKDKFFSIVRNCIQMYHDDLDFQDAFNNMRQKMLSELLVGHFHQSGNKYYLGHGQRAVTNDELDLLLELFNDNPSDPFVFSKGLRVRHVDSHAEFIKYIRENVPSLEERSKIYGALIASALVFEEIQDVDELIKAVRKFERSPKTARLLSDAISQQVEHSNKLKLDNVDIYTLAAKGLRSFIRPRNDVRKFSHDFASELKRTLPEQVLMRWVINGDLGTSDLFPSLEVKHGAELAQGIIDAMDQCSLLAPEAKTAVVNMGNLERTFVPFN